MNAAVLLVAEASPEVGLGHVAEMQAVSAALQLRGVATTPVALSPAPLEGMEHALDYDAIIQRLRALRPGVVGWSVRTDGWRHQWKAVAALTPRHLWIADIPDDHPPVDVLVVPTLEPRWRPAATSVRVFAGPEYFPLDRRGARDVPPLRTRGKDILLTLGGADPTETTLRLLPALEGTRSTVVVGPLFRHGDRVRQAAAAAGADVVVAPDGLRDLLVQHRLVISSGGNTLFEAAAAGTPALVVWEYPHEGEQGAAFAAHGTARVVGCGAVVDVAAVGQEAKRLLESADLAGMSAAGLRLVDGRGSDRIAALLVDLAAGAAA